MLLVIFVVIAVVYTYLWTHGHGNTKWTVVERMGLSRVAMTRWSEVRPRWTTILTMGHYGEPGVPANTTTASDLEYIV